MHNNNYFTRFSRQWEAIKTQFKKLPKKERTRRELIYGAVLLVVLFIGAWVGGQMVRWFLMMMNPSGEFYGPWYYGFTTPIGILITLFFLGACIFLGISYLFKRAINNGTLSVDERGVIYALNGDHGTANFMNEQEIKKSFNVSDVLDTKETIFGQLTEDGTQVVSFKAKTKGATGNQNLFVVGSPGTGKSYVFVRTAILQAMLRGASIVATDPSGELYQDLGELLRRNGYTVMVLNLAEPRYSDFWNCIEEVIDEETGRLDGTRLNDFTDIYVKNSGDPNGGGDKFWSDGAINLLRAIIGYTSWQRESDITFHYRELYEKVSIDPSSPEAKEVLRKAAPENLPAFTWFEKVILETAVKNGFDEAEIKQTIQDIKDSAPSFTMRDVYRNLMTFRSIETSFNEIPLNHPAKAAYIIFSDASDTVKASTINGTRLRMQIFADEKLVNALSYDGIKISDINLKKCAFFVNMSDKSKATTPIASLFFSFFFKDAQENWDKYSKIAEEKGEKNPCYDTFVALDEFFSIGVIGGDPNSFATTMSVNRKRHIAINIIVQSVAQLPALYGEENALNIRTCCDYAMLLGCNDEETANLFSKFYTGQTTIMTERHNESANVLGTLGDGANMSMSSTKRNLLNVDELRRWKDKILLVKRGENPVELKPFPWILHPCYVNGEVKKVSIYSTIVPIEDRVREIESRPRNSAAKTSMKIGSVKSAYSKNMIAKNQVKVEQTSLDIDDNSKNKKLDKHDVNNLF